MYTHPYIHISISHTSAKPSASSAQVWHAQIPESASVYKASGTMYEIPALQICVRAGRGTRLAHPTTHRLACIHAGIRIHMRIQAHMRTCMREPNYMRMHTLVVQTRLPMRPVGENRKAELHQDRDLGSGIHRRPKQVPRAKPQQILAQ